jgi:hypothetical protein
MALLALVCLTCALQFSDYAIVANVDGAGIPLDHAINVLKAKGIEAGGMGSLVYGIIVSKKDEARAIQELSRDAATHPYNYFSIPGYKGKLGPPDESTWPLRKFNVDIEKIDSAPEFKTDANLRGLARESARQMDRWFPRIKKVRYFIKEMRLLTVEYMGADGHLQNGYLAEVTIGYRGQSGSASLWIYSWNKGRNQLCRGGSASTPQ